MSFNDDQRINMFLWSVTNSSHLVSRFDAKLRDHKKQLCSFKPALNPPLDTSV